MTTVTVETPVRVEAPFTSAYPELLDAADLLRNRGWTQGEPCDEEGRLCVLAALAEVVYGGEIDWDELRHYSFPCFNALADAVGGEPDDWNDEEGRTFDEVLGTLERVGWLGA